MMVAVFLMQPLGQLISQLVAYGVLLGYNNSYDLHSCFKADDDNGNCGRVVDSIWRWVAGVGAIPALVALIFRFQIDDPGLYDLDVKDEGTRAVQNTMMLYRYRRVSTQIPNLDAGVEMDHRLDRDGRMQQRPPMNGAVAEQDEKLPTQFSKEDIRDYFFKQGNWRTLAGTSMCWFLLDIAFYGLGMGNPSTLAKLWTYSPDKVLGDVPSWNPNAARPGASIFDALRDNAVQNLITVCI
ncbi:hypothetical protein C8A01DRAFT_41904, partial [Parachaetomium inaequale]